ncbi:uncharacterized protein APUU_50709S [Aspergillus puulaauensis]|uniref:Uncharacterized protein n=1 Tax=Aspergillus puulaauensis TaxID=1220207 RepID=A0A7R7XS92_9EURO|nr:uncharacterized protein APUU_50709S [Aspergillus puulaauensis]BCS25998.1 hypothetical protein APUU_50709S [Aspergillus puulaauensis]
MASYENLPDPLHGLSPEGLNELEAFAQDGGPDLSDLRGYSIPRMSDTTPDRTMATEAYTSKLQQHLINNQIYPDVHMYLNRPPLLPPANFGGILRMLSCSRSSLHSSSSSKVDFDAFGQVNSRAANDQEVLNEVVPLIEGNHGPVDECGGYPFRNMSQITNKMLRPVKPDRFYGANGDTLDRTVCEG